MFVKKLNPLYLLIVAFFLSGMTPQGALTMEEEKEKEAENNHTSLSRGKRSREGKQEREEPKSKNPRVEASNYFSYLPPEIQRGVFPFLCKGGNDAIKAFISSAIGQDSQFDKIRELFKLATPNNLTYSIPSKAIINYHLGRPVVFNFEEGFVERECWDPKAPPYEANTADIKALNLFFTAIGALEDGTKEEKTKNKIHKVSLEQSLPEYRLLLESFLENLKGCDLRKLVLQTDETWEEGTRSEYETYFLSTQWPVIKKMPSLRSLDIDLEDEARLNDVVRDITALDLPLESLTIGFINLTGELADGVALLIANSSFLIKLTVHDIITDLESLRPIMISAMRKPSFKKFKITVTGNGNDVGGDDEKIREFGKDNNKFDFRWM